MDILLAIAAIAAGLFLLEVGAERFTGAIAALARRLHAAESVVGLLTAGGEWEELVVVVIALLGGHQALAAGNIIGSCIANLTGSMPLGLLGPRPLVLDRSARIYGLVLLGVTILATAVVADGSIEPLYGGLLVLVFIGYLASVLLVINLGWLAPPPGEEDDETDEELEEKPALYVLGMIIGSLVVILIGSELVVEGAVHVAHRIGLSEYAIGATIVAIGTTLPDKAISLIGGLRGQGGVVTAGATGSNIFLLTLVLGISALFSRSGLAVSPPVAHIQALFLLAVTALVVLLFQRRSLHRGTGVGLLVLYVGYVVYVLVRGA
jgi:cation:H+ antiporter